MSDDSSNDDVSRFAGEHKPPIGHSWDLIDRRVIELWLGSQSGVSLPHFAPSGDLRGFAAELKPGT